MAALVITPDTVTQENSQCHLTTSPDSVSLLHDIVKILLLDRASILTAR